MTSRKLKIAHVVSTFPPYKGGIGNAAWHMCLGLSEIGHDVTVFTPLTSEKWSVAEKEKLPFRLNPIPTICSYGNAALVNVGRLRGHYDIVHLHYPFIGLQEFLPIMKRRLTGKLVVSYHMDLIGRGLTKLIFSTDSFLTRPGLIKSADRIIVSSEDYIKHSSISQDYIRHQNKFSILGYGIDPGTLDPAPQSKHSGATRLLFVGGLDKAHYFKGLENLLAVMPNLPQTELTVVGDGDLKNEYINQTMQHGISSRVKFAGRIDDNALAEVYRQADIFILPSINRAEAFGIVLLEAMSHGVPVIASDLPGVRTVVRHGQNGLLVAPGQRDKLQAAIKLLSEDHSLRQQYGANGLDMVRNQYTWPIIVQHLDQIYQNIMAA